MAKSKAKQEDEMIKGILGLIILVGLFGTFFLTKSFSAAFIVTGLLFLLFIVVLILQQMKAAERIRKSGINDIDQMDGREFEIYLGHLFKGLRYKVEVTRAAKDYGADLIIEKGGKKIAVQAKRYAKNRVGIDAVQQIHSAKDHYRATDAWVITNHEEYTDEAKTLAVSCGVRLIDRSGLMNMMIQADPGAVSDPKTILEQAATEEKICDRCGQPMVRRKSRRGEFYGCSAYPRCRRIIPIDLDE